MHRPRCDSQRGSMRRRLPNRGMHAQQSSRFDGRNVQDSLQSDTNNYRPITRGPNHDSNNWSSSNMQELNSGFRDNGQQQYPDRSQPQPHTNQHDASSFEYNKHFTSQQAPQQQQHQQLPPQPDIRIDPPADTTSLINDTLNPLNPPNHQNMACGPQTQPQVQPPTQLHSKALSQE